MWIFTNVGFFSAVQKPGTDFLTIRARVRDDLDALREKYLPELSPTIDHAGTDYPWRATVPHKAFAAALSQLVMDIDYSNYKNEVAARQGNERAHRYGRVWAALHDMAEGPSSAHQAKFALPWSGKVPTAKAVAYGGVIFDPAGRVLLREPNNHFDGYTWTFPKGQPEPGETPEHAALREVSEETGAQVRIVAPIPGEFAGGTTINRYFLMEAEVGSGGVAPDDPETASIRWVTPGGARDLIQLTTNVQGRERDLKVLAAAILRRG